MTGLDTVGVSFPVADRHLPMTWLPRGGFVAVDRHWAYAEACLPRRVRDDNLVLANAEEAKAAIIDMVAEVDHVVRLRVDNLEDVKLCRVDCTTDFTVPGAVPAVLRSMFECRGTPRRGVKFRTRGTDMNFETVSIGTKKSWNVVMYDKFVESRDARARDVLRVETRARTKALEAQWLSRAAGLRRASDLDDEKILACAQAVFVRAALPSEFANVEHLDERFRIDWVENVVHVERGHLFQALGI